eukprot:CAMPEP_0170489104 /NCGR_PEP_ID=MMETSP0208-20121228/7505_1 /TAXON_ID=197538 /ORGANISM="Strombidium inclinatum, Strain S3" /LENGTH=41 /DNA_ID= /DNA_START= /DNA_END= /DNA_ORIENTATION=
MPLLSAYVAELELAAASHVIATINTRNPELALGALFAVIIV